MLLFYELLPIHSHRRPIAEPLSCFFHLPFLFGYKFSVRAVLDDHVVARIHFAIERDTTCELSTTVATRCFHLIWCFP